MPKEVLPDDRHINVTKPAKNGSPKGHGGPKRGGGRPKGSKNKTTSKLEQLLQKLLNKAIDDREEGQEPPTSLELLRKVYLSRNVPFALRQAAMKAALPYEVPKYQPLPPTPEQSGNGGEGSGGPANPQRMAHARDSLRRKLIKTVQPGVSGQVAVNSH